MNNPSANSNWPYGGQLRNLDTSRLALQPLIDGVSSGGRRWVGRRRASDKAKFFSCFIVVIIFVYCLPLIFLVIEFIQNIGLETPIDPGENKWFMAFARGHESSLNLIHKILLRLITFIAASSFAHSEFDSPNISTRTQIRTLNVSRFERIPRLTLSRVRLCNGQHPGMTTKTSVTWK